MSRGKAAIGVVVAIAAACSMAGLFSGAKLSSDAGKQESAAPKPKRPESGMTPRVLSIKAAKPVEPTPGESRVQALSPLSVSAQSSGEQQPAATPPLQSMTLRDFVDQGDPRSPPVQKDPIAEQLPTPEDLRDPDSYHRFETSQEARLVLSFASAGAQRLQEMQQDIERMRQLGATSEQLLMAEDKFRHLQDVLARIDPQTGTLDN